MQRAWICPVVILCLALLNASYTNGYSGLFQSERDHPLHSDLEFCQAALTTQASCGERLTKDIRMRADRAHRPLDRHIEDLSRALATALVGRRLSPVSTSQLAGAILEILDSAEMPASKVSEKLQEAKAALDRGGVPEESRNSVTGALLVVSQDVRGPEDNRAQ